MWRGVQICVRSHSDYYIIRKILWRQYLEMSSSQTWQQLCRIRDRVTQVQKDEHESLLVSVTNFARVRECTHWPLLLFALTNWERQTNEDREVREDWNLLPADTQKTPEWYVPQPLLQQRERDIACERTHTLSSWAHRCRKLLYWHTHTSLSTYRQMQRKKKFHNTPTTYWHIHKHRHALGRCCVGLFVSKAHY